MSWTACGARPALPSLVRPERIAETLYCGWSKEFLEAGKRRLAGDTARAATSSEVTDLRREAWGVKELVAKQELELRLGHSRKVVGMKCKPLSREALALIVF